MKFINRQTELQQLLRLSGAKSGGLAVVWGRRRVGKTRLLLEWSRRENGLYLVGDESAPSIQRKYMADRIADKFAGFNEVDYPDWHSLFARLAREAQQALWPGPIIIDELPYLAAAAPEIASVLQRWVDHEAKTAGLCVALAGSSQRMMHGIVLAPSAPLFGRAAVALRLKPIAAGYLPQVFGLKENHQAIMAHAVWGGMPRYWELAQPFGADLFAAVDALLLNPLGPLHNELDTLLLEEFPPAPALRSILDCIGAGAHRPSEMAGRLRRPVTSLSRPLSRLLDMGLIRREVPFGESEKSGKRALYKLEDPFVRSWFTLVASHRSSLAEATPKVRRHIWDRVCSGLFASTWEEMCRSAVPRLAAPAPDVAAPGPWLPASRYWRGNEPEWDVVSASLDGRTLLLGEVKWSERILTEPEVLALFSVMMEKPRPPISGPPQGRVLYAAFVPRHAKGISLPPDCCLVDADDVIEASAE
ncbi:MAG: ATP-binding protein [Acidobacteriota bacterium]|nr:ATP-binding protein [Acidobacteriota bacterium]